MIKFGAVLLSLSLLAPAVLGADAPASPPDPHLVWDLSELYPSDTAWDAERKSIAEALPGLASFKGTLGNDAARLAKALHTVSDLRRRLGRLDTYASLKRDEDTRNASNQDRLQRVELLENDFSTASALKSFVFGLKDTLRLAPHTLGDQAEGVLAASGEVRGAPGRIYTLLANADLPWPTVTLSDGRQVKLDSQGYTATRDLPNRDDRKKVFDAFFGKWAEYKNSFGATLGCNVEGTIFEAHTRHYPNSVSFAIAKHNIPETVYRALVDEANKGLPTLYRYFELRKKLLGLPELHY